MRKVSKVRKLVRRRAMLCRHVSWSMHVVFKRGLAVQLARCGLPLLLAVQAVAMCDADHAVRHSQAAMLRVDLHDPHVQHNFVVAGLGAVAHSCARCMGRVAGVRLHRDGLQTANESAQQRTAWRPR